MRCVVLVVWWLAVLGFPVLSSAQNVIEGEDGQMLLTTQPLVLPPISPPVSPPISPLANESAVDGGGEGGIVRLNARLTKTSSPLREGGVWRIFSLEPDFNNRLPLVATKEGGGVEFRLEPKKYLVHMAFGLAEMTKQIEIEPGKIYDETMVLDAGGFALDATIAGLDDKTTINKNLVKFSIHEVDEAGDDRAPIIQEIKAGSIVRLKAGSYHVTSSYGSANAIADANIRVEAGKLTQAVIEHRAAQVTLKLVRTLGGEALADTRWVIISDSGDTVHEAATAYVYLVLAEGDYTAYVRNKEQNYQQEFTVVAGHDMEIDVLATNENNS